MGVEEDGERPSGWRWGFYDVFVVVVGMVCGVWVRGAVGVVFAAVQVVDLLAHTHVWSGEWLLRAVHHWLLIVIVWEEAYQVAFVFLRTHLYIVVALVCYEALIPWISSLLVLDEALLVLAMVRGEAWIGRFAPHCLALLAVRPALLRLVLKREVVARSWRLKAEFAVRLGLLGIAAWRHT